MPGEKYNFDVETIKNAAKNQKLLTSVSSPVEVKRKRGRPRKYPVVTLLDPETGDTYNQPVVIPPLPKLELPDQKVSLDFWRTAPIFFDFPKDMFGKWNRIKLNEKSKDLLNWLWDCQNIVDGFFGENVYHLKIYARSKYFHVIMQSLRKNLENRSFAFVEKATGDLYKPIVYNHASEDYSGNICDPDTRLSIVTPYGIKSYYTWMPTHPDYKKVESHDDCEV